MSMVWRIKKLIQDYRYRKVDIGDNSRINLGVQISNPQNMKIGDNTYINGGVFSISENSKICIGNDCLISYNVHFRTVSHYYENKNELIRNQGEFEKDIIIEDDVWVGYGAQIMPGVTVHRGAVIGAGAVVTRDVLPYTVSGGASQSYQNSQIVLSIIVPVYNTAKQLRRCLDSIVPQLNNKVEVILVNDGSTDNSKDIICDYIDHYNQFRLYDKPNEGVSAARNIGLKVASGKYVTFLDSDDYVEPDYMRKIIENIHKMEQDELDLMIFGFYRKVGENCRVNLPDAKGNIIKEIFTQKYNAPWNKIFKKSLIDAYELEFPVSMKTSEDFLFLLDYVQNTCKIGVADECCIYNYCDNPCGAVNNTKEQYLIDTIKIYHKIQAMMKNHSISYINEIENSIMERYYYIVYNLLRMGDNKKELRSILYTLNFDLKQMLNLDRKNKLKRFLVEHQLFSIIERSIKR